MNKNTREGTAVPVVHLPIALFVFSLRPPLVPYPLLLRYQLVRLLPADPAGLVVFEFALQDLGAHLLVRLGLLVVSLARGDADLGVVSTTGKSNLVLAFIIFPHVLVTEKELVYL